LVFDQDYNAHSARLCSGDKRPHSRLRIMMSSEGKDEYRWFFEKRCYVAYMSSMTSREDI